MNKYIALSLMMVVVAGCATRSAGPVERRGKVPPPPAKVSARSSVDDRIDAFLRDYVGARFGDDISAHGAPLRDRNSNFSRTVKMRKSFGDFNVAVLDFRGGRLTRVTLRAELGRKSTPVYVEKRMNKGLSDVAVRFGLDSDWFQTGNRRGPNGVRPGYSMKCDRQNHSYSLVIEDTVSVSNPKSKAHSGKPGPRAR